MEPSELTRILDQHRLWLKDASTGLRADLLGADLRDAVGLPIVDDAPARLQAVAAAVLADPASLNMGHWHSPCGTAHCIAGMAIAQAGPIGKTLEVMHGAYMAGLLLLGTEAASHFFDSNEDALAWLQSIAPPAVTASSCPAS